MKGKKRGGRGRERGREGRRETETEIEISNVKVWSFVTFQQYIHAIRVSFAPVHCVVIGIPHGQLIEPRCRTYFSQNESAHTEYIYYHYARGQIKTIPFRRWAGPTSSWYI